jgi:hypothetical protein
MNTLASPPPSSAAYLPMHVDYTGHSLQGEAPSSSALGQRPGLTRQVSDDPAGSITGF